jgi:hypothetical protein
MGLDTCSHLFVANLVTLSKTRVIIAYVNTKLTSILEIQSLLSVCTMLALFVR